MVWDIIYCGFFNGWKNWCINHAVDCVQNITIGDFPPMILQTHEQYLAGARAANASGNSMCPNVREEWVEEINCNVGGCISMLRKSWIAYKIARGKGYVQMILYK